MTIQFQPIGFAYLKYKGNIPKHWSISDVEGTLVIHEHYREGLQHVQPGQRIMVVFHFHRSPAFTSEFLTQALPHRPEQMGVFSLRSPIRPNAIGLSVVEVLRIEECVVHIKGMDMFDETPILDIKPYKE
jgi:tRNA-Thr(GGU) m(6)t(6)A37 methyltransferase TsaA